MKYAQGMPPTPLRKNKKAERADEATRVFEVCWLLLVAKFRDTVITKIDTISLKCLFFFVDMN